MIKTTTRCCAIFLCICLALAAHAQSNYANLHGIVRDPHGQPVPNTTVVLTALATGATRDLITNSEGLYEAPLIAAGTYSISMGPTGYASLNQNLILEVEQNLALDFHLQLASLS